jgi:hypothetical protein
LLLFEIRYIIKGKQDKQLEEEMNDQDNYPNFEVEAETVDDVDVEAEAEGEALLDEVDTPQVDETDTPVKDEAPKKVVKKVGGQTRPPVPEGYITPVQWAKELSEAATKTGRANGELKENEVYEIPPQQIYSYLNQAKKSGAKNPLPSHSAGGRNNLLKRDEVNAWWAAKEQRKAERAAGGGSKKTVETPKTESAEPVVEAE